MEYNEENYLQISGIQHFLFCKRQWALIHIENQWAENILTTEGELMHKNAHNPELHEKRNNKIIFRALRVFSPTLGVSGECDVVEFIKSDSGIGIPGYEGTWIPYPIEYKRGKEKFGDYDKAQLCTQAMCLEHMYCCTIPSGALYYGELRHRVEVEFTEELRNEVKDSLKSMHAYWERGYTPKAVNQRKCDSCSLKNLCLPELENTEKVSNYLKRFLKE